MEGKTELNLNKKFTLIQISKNFSENELMFRFNKEGDSIIYIYHDYSLPGYFSYYPVNEENNIIMLNNFTFNITRHYQTDIKLMENECYYLIIQTDVNNSNINVNIDKSSRKNDPNKKSDTDDEDDDLKSWHIILIVLSSILVVIAIIIAIYCLRKNKLSSEEIEEKTKGLIAIE